MEPFYFAIQITLCFSRYIHIVGSPRYHRVLKLKISKLKVSINIVFMFDRFFIINYREVLLHCLFITLIKVDVLLVTY